jgi:hypothetical protein
MIDVPFVNELSVDYNDEILVLLINVDMTILSSLKPSLDCSTIVEFKVSS